MVNRRVRVPRLHCCYELEQRGLNGVQELRERHQQQLMSSRPWSRGHAGRPAPGQWSLIRLTFPTAHCSFLLLTHITKHQGRELGDGRRGGRPLTITCPPLFPQSGDKTSKNKSCQSGQKEKEKQHH